MFSKLSKDITKHLDHNTKKSNGIYFTPPNITTAVINSVFTHIKTSGLPIGTILEPSCGSGEFITSIVKYINENDIPIKTIDAIEYNDYIYNSIKYIDWGKNVTIKQNDFLTTTTDTKYDLIIGNPPYYVTSKTRLDKKYHPYFTGRPNIYVPFIIHCRSSLSNVFIS